MHAARVPVRHELNCQSRRAVPAVAPSLAARYYCLLWSGYESSALTRGKSMVLIGDRPLESKMLLLLLPYEAIDILIQSRTVLLSACSPTPVTNGPLQRSSRLSSMSLHRYSPVVVVVVVVHPHPAIASDFLITARARVATSHASSPLAWPSADDL